MIDPTTEETPRTPTLAPGMLIANRFLIESLLGVGGMGAVYAARDTTLGEVVALKSMLPELDHDGSALRRFKREVQYARMIAHRNVCRIFDFGQHDLVNGGQTRHMVFVTMELLAGETLASFVEKSGPLSVAQALPIARQMAAGLGAAHAAGVVHRDLKMANVMVVPGKTEPRVVITDFGIAFLVDEESNAEGRLTMTGFFIGSPRYVAPEQIDGGDITPRTDIYAFGLVLYEMLTGRFPFEGATPRAAALRRLNEPPTPPRKYLPTIDRAWEAVILRCLARNAADRFQSMEEVIAALEAAPADATGSEPLPVEPRTVETRRRRVWWQTPAFTAAAILLIAVAAFTLWLRRNHADPVTAAQASGVVETPGSDQLLSNARPQPGDLRALAERAYRRHDFAQSRRLLETAAAAGDVEAQARLGWLTYICLGGPCDQPKATRLLEGAAEGGSRDAEAWVSWLWINRGSNKLRALEYAHTAADRGKLVGVLTLGYAYENGVGVRKDIVSADRQYRLALPGLTQNAESGDPWSQAMLASLYQFGRGGLTVDDAKATELYRKSSDGGYPTARRTLAEMYITGSNGLPKDVPKGLALLQSAAAQGPAGALHVLANQYAAGVGVAKDERKAAELYQRAANDGYEPSITALGIAYRDGLGVAKDEAKALTLLRAAADRGYAPAAVTLGLMYATGHGVAKDDAKAVEMYAQAAEQGDAYGQLDLAFMYENGRGGLPKSRAEALKLYRKAAAAGNASAKQAVVRLSARG